MIGQQVGNYRIVTQIGAGGMGEVYLAEHTTIGTRVAIKVLMAAISKDKEQVERFFNEARAVNKVRHAGPVKIYDVGYHNDSAGVRQAYLVMEFLDGESLAGRIKRLGTLPGDQVADIGRQIAGVLDAVHTAGITHRDLKPDNIFLIPDHELPSGERVKVLDFGIAKLTGTMSGGGPQTKGTMGTPAYMAPEQWNNAASVDGRADTYSLGCVMFEMAVGKPPFPSQSIGEACNHHLNSKPPRTSEHMRSVPPEFDNLVDRMLSKQSDQRPTIKEVSRAFDDLRQSGATTRWTAAMVAGVAQTMGPTTNTPTPYSQGQAYGSQPAIHQGSQPNMMVPQGHQPGMQNPLSQQYPAQPSQQYPAQSGSQPYIPPQGGSQPYIPAPHNTPPPQHFTPQHTTPIPQHHTPQHHTPQHPTPPPGTYPPGTQPPQQPGTYPPQSGTYPPQGSQADMPPKSKKGLIFALVGIAVVGGGVAVAVTQLGGKSDKIVDAGTHEPSGGSVVVNEPKDGGGEKSTDAPVAVAIDAPGPSLRDQILAKNPFVNRHGVRVMTAQINAREYELVMGAKPPVAIAKPEDAVHSITQLEATEFCTKINARLPTSDEWTQAAKGAWGIAVGPDVGPLQEWTSTVQDELAIARGGHEKMDQATLDKHAKSKPPYFIQKDPGGPGVDRKLASSPTLGFRCVDAPPLPAKAGVAPKPGDAKVEAKPDLPTDLKVGGPDRFARTWIRSVNKSFDKTPITEVTLMVLTITGDQVKGTMTEALTVGDGRSMIGGVKKYMNYSAVKGTVAGNVITITSAPTGGDTLPTGFAYCAMSGKLTITDDAKKPGHFRLAGSMTGYGKCAGSVEGYEFKDR